LAYNRNYQYVQIASNSSAGLPIDRWVLAGQYIRPIRSDQISLGAFRNFDQNRWELSVEGYYKDLDQVIDLRNGARILLSDQVETELLSGRGWAYGAEFLLRKNKGPPAGWGTPGLEPGDRSMASVKIAPTIPDLTGRMTFLWCSTTNSLPLGVVVLPLCTPPGRQYLFL
jgi:hypothetical protein